MAITLFSIHVYSFLNFFLLRHTFENIKNCDIRLGRHNFVLTFQTNVSYRYFFSTILKRQSTITSRFLLHIAIIVVVPDPPRINS